MTSHDASGGPKPPEASPPAYRPVKVNGARLRIPESIRRVDRVDERLGSCCWSFIFLRDNGLGEVEIRTRFNLMLTAFCGTVLFTDESGRTQLMRKDSDVLCLLPGRYRVRSINPSERGTLFYCMVFDDPTVRLWLDWGYIRKPNTLIDRGKDRVMHPSSLQYLGNLLNLPPGQIGFCLLRNQGEFCFDFSSFLRAGVFRDEKSEGGDYLCAGLNELPHLNWIEKRRRKKYPELRERLLRLWKGLPSVSREGSRIRSSNQW